MNIYELIQRVQSFYPLEGYMKESVRDFWEVKYNYNSNAIEGTTFTEIETIEVLKGNTIPFHVMREHFEVINHRKAFDFVIELSKTNWEAIFNEKNILMIHELILTNINDDYAGRYRNMNVRISGSSDVLPNHLKVPELMESFIGNFLSDYKKLDLTSEREILTYGYKLHLDFVKIHPFIDGNGRTSRLLMNMWFLSNFGFIDVIYFKNRAEYIKNIGNSKEDLNKYFDFMDSNFTEFLDEFLPILEEKIYYKL